MEIKKTAKKPFHNGNRLNGNGGNNHASYGVFQNGKQIGQAHRVGGLWEAYSTDGKTRLNSYGCISLEQLKKLLSK